MQKRVLLCACMKCMLEEKVMEKNGDWERKIGCDLRLRQAVRLEASNIINRVNHDRSLPCSCLPA